VGVLWRGIDGACHSHCWDGELGSGVEGWG
jgi:hypothetical protein